jgi:hypothetical protein
MSLKTSMQKTAYSKRTGPNFVHLHDPEQDQEKLFKKYHINDNYK